jgi:hypothetical protein
VLAAVVVAADFIHASRLHHAEASAGFVEVAEGEDKFANQKVMFSFQCHNLFPQFFAKVVGEDDLGDFMGFNEVFEVVERSKNGVSIDHLAVQRGVFVDQPNNGSRGVLLLLEGGLP